MKPARKAVIRSRKFRARKLGGLRVPITKNSVVGMREPYIMGSSGVSKRSEKRAVKWVNWVEAVAYAQWAGGTGSPEGLDELAFPYFEWKHQEEEDGDGQEGGEG